MFTESEKLESCKLLRLKGVTGKNLRLGWLLSCRVNEVSCLQSRYLFWVAAEVFWRPRPSCCLGAE